MSSKFDFVTNPMIVGGQKLAEIKKKLVKMAKPGIFLEQIETEAQKLIGLADGKPSFAMVPQYSWATCLNLNDGLVHGVPDQQKISEGDVVSIDVGLYFAKHHTDTSVSFIATNLTSEKQKTRYQAKINFLNTGKLALTEAIKQARAGNHIGHISLKMQTIIEAAGFSVARNLTGHGIGKKLHQSPTVPCFLDTGINQTPRLKKGMTLAIEAIYLAGKHQTITDESDHWTIRSQDGKITAVFEETIVVTDDDPIILTKL
jgi:methionyl aminopeptidase